MAVSVSAYAFILETPMPEISTMAEVAETIRNDALARAYEALPPVMRDGDLQRLLLCPEYFHRLKYRLAAGVARELSANDPRVQAVYIYEPTAGAEDEAGGEPPLDPTLHMLVMVTAPSAALQSFVESLDRALTLSLRQLPSPGFARRDSVLDVNLVTEEEARHGTGWAALLTSAFAPPTKLWERA